MTSSNTFKPLGPAPIQDPFVARLNKANPWGSGKVTGAINTLELVQNPDTKDGTLYAGSVSGGVWSRKYNGATDSWNEDWKWLSSSSDYKGVQSISKLKVTTDSLWLIAAAGAVSSFKGISGDIQEPLQLASLGPDGVFKQWLPNAENNQDLIKGQAVTALEINDNLVIIGTNKGLYVGEIDGIDGELKKINATSLNINIDSIAIGESGRVYAAQRIIENDNIKTGGIYTTTISELKQNSLSAWKVVEGSQIKSENKAILRLSTTKDLISGKDILYLGTASNDPPAYDFIYRVVYDEQAESQAWVTKEVLGKIGSDQANIHTSFAADPTDPNRVFAGGNRYETYPDRYTGGLVAIKFDGIAATLENHFSSPEQPTNAAGTATHADSRNIIFLETKQLDKTGKNIYRIIEADDGGIAIKDIDVNEPWQFYLNEEGLRTTESFASDWSNVGNLAITAMQDNAASITKYNSTPTWLNVTGDDGAHARFDDAKRDNINGLSFAYYGSQCYIYNGVLEKAAYDKSGVLTRAERIELDVLDSFGNFQDFLNYDMIKTGFNQSRKSGYDFYLPFETNAYRANDIVLAGQRNLYEQIVPDWQLPTYGEMQLAPLIEDIDFNNIARRKFTAVEIGSKQGEILSKSKPYNWDALYTSFYEIDKNKARSNTHLYGRKAGEATGKETSDLELINNFKLVDLSTNLPDIARNNLITGITINPNNSDELWASISRDHVVYGSAPTTPEQFLEKSYLIYSSDGGKNWETLIESGKNNGIPLNAQLQQVQYVPERDGKLAELYLGGYGGIWQAIINNDGKPSAFKSVNWDGLGENPNFNLWNTNLEYDPIDDVLIASIIGQGGWILNRSPLEAAPAATPGLRISQIVIPQNNKFLKRKKDREIEGVMTVSLERTDENRKSVISVDLALDAGWEKYINLTKINQPNLDDLEGKNTITLNFPVGIDQLSFYINTVQPYTTLPDIEIGINLKNPVNSIIASDSSSGYAYLYANGETIMLREEAEGVYYSDNTQSERDNKQLSQAQQLAVLMPRSNLNKGDQLFWFKVNEDGEIEYETGKFMAPYDPDGNIDPNYIEVAKKQFNNPYQLIGTSTQAYDARAFSPEKAALAFSNPNVVLSSEGVSIGDISSTAGSNLPSQDRFALALQDSKGNVRVSTQGSNLDLNPALDNTLMIGKAGIGSQVVLAPAQGELFVADINFLSSDTVPADRIEYNLDVARFGNYNSGCGIFRVDDPYGNFYVINNEIMNTPIQIGSLDYAREALKRSLSNGLDGITVMPTPGFAQSTKESIILATGNYYGLYITPNQIIKSEDQLTELSQILFSIKNANQDKELQHVSMGTGYFAFEDMGFAGDRDFNDMLFAITPKNPSIIG